MKVMRGGIRSGLKLFYPPPSASHEPAAFGAWLKHFGEKLLVAGITDVNLIPMVGGDETLFVGIETDEVTGHRIRRALYN